MLTNLLATVGALTIFAVLYLFMTSEFEEHRKKRLFDDLNDVLLVEGDEEDVCCEECGSLLFKMRYDRGFICAGCEVDVDISSLNVNSYVDY